MLIYLYGLPGTGKNFIGEIFKSRFNFYFQDADEYLPIKMKNKLKNGKHFTKEDVCEYHHIIANKIFKLREKHKKLVRFAFPLWLYVAVSGVVVYLMISPYY